jgi:hypothetical protein
MVYDPNDDWVPPKPVYMDDIIVRDPELGNVPFWKSLLWNTARARTEMARADSVGTSALGEEEKPPPLVADAGEPLRQPIPPEVLDAIYAKIDELNARLDAFERVKEAENALLELERRIEAETPPSEDDDDDDLLLN